MTDKELANLKLSNLKEDSDACGPVSHVEAFDHLLRFKNKAFGCSGDTPILCIPANPRTDSDLRLGAYIYQCWERDHATELARLRAEVEILRRYAGSNLIRSDFRTADEMRAAYDRLRAENERLRRALETIRNEHDSDGHFCRMCGGSGGRWPCGTRAEADAALNPPPKEPNP